MTVRAENDVIYLTGRCLAEDAEPLLELLSSGVDQVDLTGCEHIHTAVAQLLMASAAEVRGASSPFVRDWLLPVLGRHGTA